ncbi:MFS transporter [Oecophyllibacter saccharovorans]|uniref:peptide MFS transporter n=1 Tax=Oecophyllibacter saccharovorans TaxID=2558360 RepID=UPI0011419D14|nr:oligopeptide:H+ symporter [Oecophyllibacter saccharovorans]QDH15403.1 MFS transporter [Oecophyllibacter saccharovorans]
MTDPTPQPGAPERREKPALSARGPSAASARRQAFSVVLAIELWERFGFYGMQAVLTLFMVETLHMREVEANLMLGSLGMLIYTLPVVGGYIGDRLTGTRPILLAGALGLTAGYGMLALSISQRHLFLPALALIALSNGLFKPNAGTLVRRIFAGDSAALDAAFTLYYMSINVGSTVSMLLMPWLQLRFGAGVAFLACALGLLMGVGYYLWRQPLLTRFFSRSPAGGQLRRRPLALWQWGLLIGGLLVLWAGSVLVLGDAALARFCVIGATLGLLVLWAVLYRRVPGCEKAGLALTYLLCLETVAYQVFYQQMQTSLTLFALRGVDGTFYLGHWPVFTMSAAQFQALNPIWIMIFSPILAWLYHRAARRGHETGPALKIAIGYGCVALGFLLWWQAARTATTLVSPWVMVAGYGIVSLGELLTIGLGLAIVARYAPARLSALLMGGLFLLWGAGMYVGSLVANLAALPIGAGEATGPHFYAPLFHTLFLGASGLCLLVVLLLPLARRLERLHAEVSRRADRENV